MDDQFNTHMLATDFFTLDMQQASDARFAMVLHGVCGPALLIWAMARTPFASMHQCRRNATAHDHAPRAEHAGHQAKWRKATFGTPQHGMDDRIGPTVLAMAHHEHKALYRDRGQAATKLKAHAG